MPDNLDEMDRSIALILAWLLERAPTPQLLDTSTIEPEAPRERWALHEHCINLLIDEGIIRTLEHAERSPRDSAAASYRGARLTLKAYAILRSVPKTLREQKPISDHLRSAVASGSTEALKAVVTAFTTAAATHLLGP